MMARVGRRDPTRGLAMTEAASAFPPQSDLVLLAPFVHGASGQADQGRPLESSKSRSGLPLRAWRAAGTPSKGQRRPYGLPHTPEGPGSVRRRQATTWDRLLDSPMSDRVGCATPSQAQNSEATCGLHRGQGG